MRGWSRKAGDSCKSEIRNPKSETNSNKTEKAMTETGGYSVSVIVPDSDFEFVSDFGFRISDLKGLPRESLVDGHVPGRRLLPRGGAGHGAAPTPARRRGRFP